MSGDFHDPYDEMSDEEFDEQTAQLLEQLETTVELRIDEGWYEQIKALARRRAHEPVHQMMVRALNLGLRQIEEETKALESKPSQPSRDDLRLGQP